MKVLAPRLLATPSLVDPVSGTRVWLFDDDATMVTQPTGPMDAATAQANDAAYLDAHLKEVLLRHETLRDVDVVGLGIGRDLSAYYRHCATLDPAAPLDMKRLAGVARWIGARR